MLENHSPSPWIVEVTISLLLAIPGFLTGAFISQNVVPTGSTGSGKSAQLREPCTLLAHNFLRFASATMTSRHKHSPKGTPL